MPNALIPGYPDTELQGKLYAIVDEMLAPFGKKSPRPGFSFFSGPQPFDISKPNMHDTKAEFSREYTLVTDNLKRVVDIVDSLFDDEDDADRSKTISDFIVVLNDKMRSNATSLTIKTPHDLIRKSVADCGAYFGVLLVLLDFQRALSLRLEELNVQRERFWSIGHRAPDYYARAIANRLAKVYARETGERPTVGSHPETGQPSTGFTRALQQVFALLDISSDVRSPAKWAVDNLKDEDLGQPRNVLAALLHSPVEPRSTRDQIADMLAKRPAD